jgi:hypothetical protein
MTAITILFVGALVAFVAWPLLRPAEAADAGEDSLPPLERQKVEAYAAIREAQFDRQMGKLSEADFAALEQRYRQQALAAIAAIEKSRARPRAARTAAGAKGVRFAFCPSCGKPLPTRANFCGGCGRSLREEVA